MTRQQLPRGQIIRTHRIDDSSQFSTRGFASLRNSIKFEAIERGSLSVSDWLTLMSKPLMAPGANANQMARSNLNWTGLPVGEKASMAIRNSDRLPEQGFSLNCPRASLLRFSFLFLLSYITLLFSLPSLFPPSFLPFSYSIHLKSVRETSVSYS